MKVLDFGLGKNLIDDHGELSYLQLEVRSNRVAAGLKAKGIKVVVYEPVLQEDEFFGSAVVRDLQAFKQVSDVIVANRASDDLCDVEDKVFTRDIFGLS